MTELEKRLARAERTQGSVLVPLFEAYHQQFSSSHWDKDDIEFLHDLMERVAEREKDRELEPVYSPSGLGGCLRQSFLNRHCQELGIPRKLRKKIETHFYFENGTWIHLKIQVKLYRLHKVGEIELLGTEIPVSSKHGDNRGTLDAVFRRGLVYGVDIKGWNSRDFLRLAGGDCPMGAQLQLGNYIILANSARRGNLPRIEKGIILAENKSGPVNTYPAAVAEYEIPVAAIKQTVRNRLERLRAHEKEGTIPDAECRSTQEKNFKDCPFRDYCKPEVSKAERRGNRKSPRGDSKKLAPRLVTKKRAYRA
jgi:hypothetical protein